MIAVKMERKDVSNQESLYNKVLNSCHSSVTASNFSTPKNNCISPLSSSHTKTTSVKKRVLYNPFNVNLKERLQNHTCSPTVFSIVVSPNQGSDDFKWTIDDLSRINPVPIEEEFIYEDKLDEETEKEIQKTIETYFKEKHLIPSPVSTQRQHSLKNYVAQFGNSTENDATSISLELPEYLSKNFELQMSSDERGIVSLPNPPRKLIFDTDEEQLSPVKLLDEELYWSPKISSCITHRSDVCFPSTPVLPSRTICTPPPNSLSPINISPIKYVKAKSDCHRLSDTSIMQVDSSSSGLHYQISCNESSELGKRSMDFEFEHCLKITDSPKRICARSKKRRKLDRNGGKLVSYQSDNKMNVDTSYNMAMVSQDTGYYTDQHTGGSLLLKNSYRSFEPIPSSSSSLSKVWDEENKENYYPITHTPTKRSLNGGMTAAGYHLKF